MKLVAWLLFVAAMAYGGAKFYLHHEVAEAMDTAVMMAAPFAEVEYDGVASTMTGELTIEGIRIRPVQYRDEIVIDRIGIDTPSFLSLLKISDLSRMRSGSIPRSFGILLEGAHIPVDADYFLELHEFGMQALNVNVADDPGARCTGKYGYAPDVLAALGYEEQVFSVAVSARSDEGHYSLAFDVSMDEMWEADARIVLAGNMMSELSLGPAYRPKLREFELEFTDRSLKDRAADYCAHLGLSKDAILSAQLDAFKYIGETNGIVFDEYMIEPYLEYLKGKSRLIITARPNDPITMSQIDLYNPKDVPALLNLEARAY